MWYLKRDSSACRRRPVYYVCCRRHSSRATCCVSPSSCAACDQACIGPPMCTCVPPIPAQRLMAPLYLQCVPHPGLLEGSRVSHPIRALHSRGLLNVPRVSHSFPAPQCLTNSLNVPHVMPPISAQRIITSPQLHTALKHFPTVTVCVPPDS